MFKFEGLRTNVIPTPIPIYLLINLWITYLTYCMTRIYEKAHVFIVSKHKNSYKSLWESGLGKEFRGWGYGVKDGYPTPSAHIYFEKNHWRNLLKEWGLQQMEYTKDRTRKTPKFKSSCCGAVIYVDFSNKPDNGEYVCSRCRKACLIRGVL